MDTESPKCPKCDYKIFPGEVFCRKCGNYCPKNKDNNDSSNEPEMSTENKKLESYINSTVNRSAQEEKLIEEETVRPTSLVEKQYDFTKEYIGSNADRLMSGDFSFCNFFFGPLYMFYRKLWIIGFPLEVLLVLLSTYNAKISICVCFVINIIISIKFKSLYRYYVNNRIHNIKIKNSGKSDEEIARICAKKGGTSILSMIFDPSITFGICFLLMLFKNNISSLFEDNEVEPNEPVLENKVDDYEGLLYLVPNSFIKDESEKNKNRYFILSPTDSCSFTIEAIPNPIYASSEEALKALYASGTDIKTSPFVNSHESFYYIKILSTFETTYHYSIIKNNKLYIASFTISKDDAGECSSAHYKIMNSLSF